MKSFLNGVARILDFAGLLSPKLSDIKSDEEAILSDWRAILSDWDGYTIHKKMGGSVKSYPQTKEKE